MNDEPHTDRELARQAGEIYYIGKPCVRGCGSLRYVAGKEAHGRCVACHKRGSTSLSRKHVLVTSAKIRAKKDNLPFDITVEDIEIPETCPVLGIPIFKGTEKFGPNSPSLDKIKPELGYVRGNIAVISHRANMIKSNATVAELRRVADWLAEKA